MVERIDSIYYFDYTKAIGHYDSIRDFASLEMRYIGLALSTPKIHVNATPDSFSIQSNGSAQIREYTVSQLANLREISKELAVNSPKYILICYFDGTQRFFEYSETFCALFNIAFQYRPKEEVFVSPYAIQKSETLPHYEYTRPTQSLEQQYTQRNSSDSHSPTRTMASFRMDLLLIICIIVATVIISGLNVDKGLTPVTEPRSGEILWGREVYDGSELTITASGGEACVVKLKTREGEDRMCFYVRAGETVTVDVPAGYFYVYFASGKTWYGIENLFGERTSYSMDDEICNFLQYTWEYTLYPVSDGNFSETPIDASDF